MSEMTHSQRFLTLAAQVAAGLDHAAMDRLVGALAQLRADGGRLFCFGAGGSAANCTHCVNDFRKLCGIEAYSATDNVAELTARVNDDGWDTVFDGYLRVSRAAPPDAVLVLSVGGGDIERGISVSLVRGIDEAHRRGLKVYAIVGRAAGYAASAADEAILVPAPDATLITPMAEAFQAVIWHALVSDPRLLSQATVW
jgi:D-sedoheptulose 7-phosphate isomerase